MVPSRPEGLMTASLGWPEVVWAVLIFLVTSTASVLVVLLVLIRLPDDYYREGPSPVLPEERRSRLGFWAVRLLKNGLGALLIIVGVCLSLPGVPGQGVLTILAGLLLTDLPGKGRLARWLVRRPGVLRTLNHLRGRFGKPPLVVDGAAQEKNAKPGGYARAS